MHSPSLNKTFICDLNEIAAEVLFQLLFSNGGRADWREVYKTLCVRFSIGKPIVRGLVRRIQQNHPEELGVTFREIKLLRSKREGVRA